MYGTYVLNSSNLCMTGVLENALGSVVVWFVFYLAKHWFSSQLYFLTTFKNFFIYLFSLYLKSRELGALEGDRQR